MTLLRQYAPEECGPDGYPFAWHLGSAIKPVPGGPCETTGCGGTLLPAIKDYVREEAGHRCERCHHPYPPGIAETHPRGEWTPCDEQCEEHSADGARLVDAVGVVIAEGRGNAVVVKSDLSYVPVEPIHYEAQWRILTVHHLDGDKSNCRWWNLAALCQRCHLVIQGRVRMEQLYVLEHTEWFKPHAAGYYALKYCDQELTREETMAQLDDLLAWERIA